MRIGVWRSSIGKNMSYIRVSQSGLRWRPSGPNFPTIFYLFVLRVRFCFRKSWRTGTSSRKCIWNASDFYRHDVDALDSEKVCQKHQDCSGLGKKTMLQSYRLHMVVKFCSKTVLYWFAFWNSRVEVGCWNMKEESIAGQGHQREAQERHPPDVFDQSSLWLNAQKRTYCNSFIPCHGRLVASSWRKTRFLV